MQSATRVVILVRVNSPNEDLFSRVYGELRQLAGHTMAVSAASDSLDPTGLVHEAYLRLAHEPAFANRGHFFAAAAEAMRRILVERARARGRLKRGGGRTRAAIDLNELPAAGANDDVTALDEALTRLEARDAQAAALVKLRYFAGLSVAEAAEALRTSTRTAERLWTYARAALRVDLGGR